MRFIFDAAGVAPGWEFARCIGHSPHALATVLSDVNDRQL